mgnify:CR=1 FL=1
MNIAGWIDVFLTAGAGIAGVAVSFGYMKSKIGMLEERSKEHDERILKLEGRGINLVFRENCKEYRDDCHLNFCGKFDEIKEEIKTNRDMVESQFKEISTFMGYVKAKLEKLNNGR